jgi:hypothetical protein
MNVVNIQISHVRKYSKLLTIPISIIQAVQRSIWALQMDWTNVGAWRMASLLQKISPETKTGVISVA